MPVLTIKGMPLALYRQLKKRAAQHRRSLNSEILVALEQSLSTPPKRDVAALVARADELRANVIVAKAPKLTERTLRAMKSWGRP